MAVRRLSNQVNCGYCHKRIKVKRQNICPKQPGMPMGLDLFWWIDPEAPEGYTGNTGTAWTLWCEKNTEDGLHVPGMPDVKESLEALCT